MSRGPRDCRDVVPSVGEQVRRRSSGAAAVIGIHPWEPLVPLRPADEHRRNAEAREGLWKRVVAVERHENDAVDVPLPYVTLDLRVLRSSRAMRRRSWSSVCARAVETPRTMLGKNGSENTRVSESETTRAIVSVRRVTSVRAARLGVYPAARLRPGRPRESPATRWATRSRLATPSRSRRLRAARLRRSF